MNDFNVDAFEDEGSFQEFRAEALEYMKMTEDTILKKWLTIIGYKKPIGYGIKYSEHILEIFATRPGLLIGKAGLNVNMLKVMLAEKLRGEWTVKFTEIRGDIISIDKDETEKE